MTALVMLKCKLCGLHGVLAAWQGRLRLSPPTEHPFCAGDTWSFWTNRIALPESNKPQRLLRRLFIGCASPYERGVFCKDLRFAALQRHRLSEIVSNMYGVASKGARRYITPLIIYMLTHNHINLMYKYIQYLVLRIYVYVLVLAARI